MRRHLHLSGALQCSHFASLLLVLLDFVVVCSDLELQQTSVFGGCLLWRAVRNSHCSGLQQTPMELPGDPGRVDVIAVVSAVFRVKYLLTQGWITLCSYKVYERVLGLEL